MDNENEKKNQNIFLYILCPLIAFFTIFIIIIYLKSHTLKSYPAYFNIYFCFIITLDNILRIFNVGKSEDPDHPKAWCKAQAFALSFFDKQFLFSITTYSIISYIIMINPKLYEEQMKNIYIILIIIGSIFSLILTIIFYSRGISNSNIKFEICYVKTSDIVKQIIDSIYTFLLLFLNIFCIIRVIFKILKLMKEYDGPDNISRKQNLKHHLYRFIIDLFLNAITFGYVLILINKLLSTSMKDYIYIILCLFNELFLTINNELYREIMRTLTCNKVEKYIKKENELENKLSSEDDDDTPDN